MTEQVAYRFIEALAALEDKGDLEPILATFTDFCEIGTPASPEKLQGKDRAREFWRGYRKSFRNIHSTFRNIVIGTNSIALEWTADAINAAGKEIRYDGVTILDTAGARITHYRTYFDPRVVQDDLTQFAAASTIH